MLTVPSAPGAAGHLPDQVFSLDQAALIAGVSAATLRRQGKAEKLRIIRISPRRLGVRFADLRAYIDNCPPPTA
jgi:hypothetical protein